MSKSNLFEIKVPQDEKIPSFAPVVERRPVQMNQQNKAVTKSFFVIQESMRIEYTKKSVRYCLYHMTRNKISAGVVHEVPADWRKALMTTPRAHVLWEDITPLARNEWICWILDAKKLETRKRRIEVGLSKLTSGMRRPCCWAGCPHRS